MVVIPDQIFNYLKSFLLVLDKTADGQSFQTHFISSRYLNYGQSNPKKSDFPYVNMGENCDLEVQYQSRKTWISNQV